MLTILGYGVALAADVHSEQVSGLAHDMDKHTDGDYLMNHDNGEDAVHDHCSHGISHLLGLNTDSVFDFSTDRTNLLSSFSMSIVTLPPSPFIRPPRII